ncbi:hypothetical protein IFM89_029433 [Coptis chinensis]|uniref:Photolyase/cryptochrome alpha/beta domain-containing protein n=1 Tax=Coptis chinensis TaxID=261450 RepID=A0A835MCL3_9MAGN|nr:hypothetical protein IFM89_029433 [Coptis chinensis]
MEQNLKISTLNPTDAEQENPNPKDEIPVVPSPLPFPLFISLSLSTTLSPPPHLHSNPSSFSPFPNKLKIPSQISSLSTLSLTSTFTPHNKPSLKHTISSSPLQIPLFNTPHHSPHPKNIPAIRRCSIVWFRNDLRVHDNECLNSANNDSMSVLPVYCFNPQDYGKSSSGFNKIGSHRATFLINSVFDLRNSLKSRGSNLVVRIGKPENVLVELVKEVGADGVFVHREVSKDEVREEEKVEKAVKEEGVEVKYFWGSTLHHVDDLPFKLDDMPTNYNMFKEKAKKSEIRKTIDGLDQLKGLPTRGDVELGEIPTLLDLGLRPVATAAQVR